MNWESREKKKRTYATQHEYGPPHTHIRYTHSIYINTHLTTIASVSHIRFIQSSIRMKRRCRVVQNQSPLFSPCFKYPPFALPWSWSLVFFFFSRVGFSWQIRGCNPCAVNHMTSSCCQASQAHTDPWLDSDTAATVSSAAGRKWCLPSPHTPSQRAGVNVTLGLFHPQSLEHFLFFLTWDLSAKASELSVWAFLHLSSQTDFWTLCIRAQWNSTVVESRWYA